MREQIGQTHDGLLRLQHDDHLVIWNLGMITFQLIVLSVLWWGTGINFPSQGLVIYGASTGFDMLGSVLIAALAATPPTILAYATLVKIKQNAKVMSDVKQQSQENTDTLVKVKEQGEKNHDLINSKSAADAKHLAEQAEKFRMESVALAEYKIKSASSITAIAQMVVSTNAATAAAVESARAAVEIATRTSDDRNSAVLEAAAKAVEVAEKYNREAVKAAQTIALLRRELSDKSGVPVKFVEDVGPVAIQETMVESEVIKDLRRQIDEQEKEWRDRVEEESRKKLEADSPPEVVDELPIITKPEDKTPEK